MLAETIKQDFDKKQDTEEKIKQAMRDCIKSYAEMKGWPNKRAHFGSIDLTRLVIDSGWSSCKHTNDLSFHEVMHAVDFMIHFLQNEGFTVSSQCSRYGIDLIIEWS